MSDILMDASTGFVSADELVLLAEEPDDLAAGTGVWCATAVIVGASAALQGGCPTSGCTTRCI
ncbi:class II lanthipeptide, LchA2/BrtA2 family [Kitasatospora sp. NPDC001683]